MAKLKLTIAFDKYDYLQPCATARSKPKAST